jgi:hypothetical protein
MTNKLLFISFIVLVYALNSNAQRIISLEHNGVSSFFTDIPTAISDAVDGDTIYLPGGSFPSFNLDKKLTIVGAGHNPEFTEATSTTIVNGNLYIQNGADNSYIQGIKIVGVVALAPNATNITLHRCLCQLGVTFDGGNDDMIFYENIFGCNYCSSVVSFCGSGGQNGVFANNIFCGGFQSTIYNSIFRNNIFLYIGYNLGATDCLFENNIKNGYAISNTNCTFQNNINLGLNGNDNSGNNGDNNILNVDFNSLFTQYTDPWDYTDDFHLINPTYNTGGTDGTPIGLYGGLSPWKEGSVPFNPHIQTNQIAPTTDPSGNLNVNIQVEAQDH